MSDAIAGLAHRNHAVVLRWLSEVSQERVAELVGLNPTTVSRMNTQGDLERFSAVLAACALKVCPSSDEMVSPEYMRALQVLAKIGLAATAPKAGDD